MSAALHVGPLVLSMDWLVFTVAAWTGLALGPWAGRRAGVDPASVLLRMLPIGLIAARLAFVWQWRGAYLQAPWSVLDIRDGGWEVAAGFAAAALYGLHRAQQQPALRQPLMGATLGMLVVWGAGTLALMAGPNDKPATMPALTLPAIDGRSVALAGFVGRPTVLNLWATWCPPCRREMPLLQQAQATHPEINIVLVNQGETQDQVQTYLHGQGLAVRNLLMDAKRSTAAVFHQAALPTTLFFDAQGHLVSTRIGALSEATLAQRLQALRGAPPVPPTPSAKP